MLRQLSGADLPLEHVRHSIILEFLAVILGMTVYSRSPPQHRSPLIEDRGVLTSARKESTAKTKVLGAWNDTKTRTVRVRVGRHLPLLRTVTEQPAHGKHLG